jgi:hypothetical protein
MYEKLKAFDTPPDNQSIWRYMPFTKFAWLIANKSLYFSRLDQHDDWWEGLLPKSSDNETKKYIRYNRFINCWHMNESESDAMWKLYGGSSGETIAIKTSVGRLIQALEKSHIPVNIGEVKYEEKTTENRYNPLYSPVLYIRKPFQHERELRLCVTSELNFNPPDFTQLKEAFASLDIHSNELDILRQYGNKGIDVRVDLNQLIEEVIRCPNEKSYLKASVEFIIMKSKIPHIKIRPSTM